MNDHDSLHRTVVFALVSSPFLARASMDASDERPVSDSNFKR